MTMRSSTLSCKSIFSMQNGHCSRQLHRVAQHQSAQQQQERLPIAHGKLAFAVRVDGVAVRSKHGACEQGSIAFDGQHSIDLAQEGLLFGAVIDEAKPNPLLPVVADPPAPRQTNFRFRTTSHVYCGGTVKLGSLGSTTSKSRSQPSFSSLMC